jgi:hypothetical protein
VDSANGSVKYAPIPGKIPGTAINMGGHEFIVAPLNLDLYVQYEEQIKAIGATPTTREGLEKVLPLFLVCIQRNYSDMTLEVLRQLVDFGNVMALSTAIIETNALKLKAPGESVPASP